MKSVNYKTALLIWTLIGVGALVYFVLSEGFSFGMGTNMHAIGRAVGIVLVAIGFALLWRELAGGAVNYMATGLSGLTTMLLLVGVVYFSLQGRFGVTIVDMLFLPLAANVLVLIVFGFVFAYRSKNSGVNMGFIMFVIAITMLVAPDVLPAHVPVLQFLSRLCAYWGYWPFALVPVAMVFGWLRDFKMPDFP
jgi:uncharacterized membrane protein SirB2